MLPSISPENQMSSIAPFQWAPTLGGECYEDAPYYIGSRNAVIAFQWAPTLGGECYNMQDMQEMTLDTAIGFNGHPPLGVNATCCWC